MVEGVMFKETLEADVKILGKYSKYIISLDSLVGDIPSAKKLHSGGVIYRSEEKKLEIPLGMMSSEVSLTVADVYNFNLEKICTDIYEFAQGFLRDMTKTMFATLSQVTDFTGNIIEEKGKPIMLRRVVEDYLESIKEIQFFLPFSSLLLLKGYYDIHIIHSSAEFGKDIIAKKNEDVNPVQYVFQMKAGDVNLTKYRDEVQPQLLEAAVNNLSHPNFDSSLCKKIIFVTTGIIKPPATLAFQEFNNFIRTKYKLDPILSVEKLDLVEDFVRYGIEPFFALHNDPTFVGDFFDLYSKIKNSRALDSYNIEAYTKRWLKTDCSKDINRLQVFLEAYLFSALLYNSNQYYQAVLFIAALARYLSKCNLYPQHHKMLMEYLNLIVSNLTEDVQVIYKNNQTLADPASA